MRWEFKNLLRFPILELLVAISVYQSMLLTTTASSGLSEGSDWNWIIERTIGAITTFYGHQVVSLYVPQVFAGVIFASIGIAYEIEAEFVKVSLSHPIKRRDLFLGKFACYFLTSFLLLTGALFFSMFIQNWSVALGILAFPVGIVKILGLLLVQTFFIVSVATAIATFSKSTAISFIVSAAVLYLPYYMFEFAQVKLSFVPPESVRLFWMYLFFENSFWKQYTLSTLVEATVVPVFMALAMLLISFFYFTRRYDVR